jgi:hypothetical protein
MYLIKYKNKHSSETEEKRYNDMMDAYINFEKMAKNEYYNYVELLKDGKQIAVKRKD